MTEIDRAIEEGALTKVGEYSSLQEANEYALVLLAMNLDCWMRMEAADRRYVLYAESAYQVAIAEEFRLYAEEQSIPKDRRPEVPLYSSGIELYLLWAMVLVFVIVNQTEAIKDAYCSSRIGLFERGEWYRPFTSLFLHADFQHLIGNLLIGGIFCFFVSSSLGPLVGWFSILLSGTLGNIATSALNYPEEFLSLGASTATFGALGLLVGSSACVAWSARSLRKLGGAVLPVIAGSIMLGWFGTGGGDPRVDVLAHVMGFAVGAVVGLFVILLRGTNKAAATSQA